RNRERLPVLRFASGYSSFHGVAPRVCHYRAYEGWLWAGSWSTVCPAQLRAPFRRINPSRYKTARSEMKAGRFQGLRALFGKRDFRKLCVAQVFGGMGEWLATLALIGLVYDRTHS